MSNTINQHVFSTKTIESGCSRQNSHLILLEAAGVRIQKIQSMPISGTYRSWVDCLGDAEELKSRVLQIELIGVSGSFALMNCVTRCIRQSQPFRSSNCLAGQTFNCRAMFWQL